MIMYCDHDVMTSQSCITRMLCSGTAASSFLGILLPSRFVNHVMKHGDNLYKLQHATIHICKVSAIWAADAEHLAVHWQQQFAS